MKSISEYLSCHPSMTPVTVDVRAIEDFVDAAPEMRADAYVASLGFHKIGESWNRLSRNDARGFLVGILKESMAYHLPMLEEKDAERVSEAFLARFSSAEATFLSNSKVVGPGCIASSPISKSTFDAAVVALDALRIGIVCVEDED